MLIEFTHVMMKLYVLCSQRCQQSDQTHKKTYGAGETRTQEYAFHGNLLYWATGGNWTSRFSYHILDAQEETTKIKYLKRRSVLFGTVDSP